MKIDLTPAQLTTLINALITARAKSIDDARYCASQDESTSAEILMHEARDMTDVLTQLIKKRYRVR